MLVGASGAFACNGDGEAVDESLPTWAATASGSAPPWLSNNALANGWEYDSAGNSKREGQGTAADDIVAPATGSPTTGGPFPGSPGGGGGLPGGGTTDGLNLVIGCDSVFEIEGFLSVHVCIDVFDNLSPSLYDIYTPDQLCSMDIFGAGSSQDYTPYPNGCPRSGAVGVCTTSPDGLPSGYQIRLDSYFYDESTFASQGTDEDQECRPLP